MRRALEIAKILGDSGALITDNHFAVAPGWHSSAYLNTHLLEMHSLVMWHLADLLAQEILGTSVDVFFAPTADDRVLCHLTALQLTLKTGQPYSNAFAVPRRGSEPLGRVCRDTVRGQSVVVVKHVLTAGTTTEKLIDNIRSCDGNTTLVATICHRGLATAQSLGVPSLLTLMTTALPTWSTGQCALCEEGQSVVEEPDQFVEMMGRRNTRNLVGDLE